MLAKIQERDTKLKEINDELEMRVEARTQELQLEVGERVRAQEALSEERRILRALIDNVPDYMYVKDTDCRFLLANLAVARQMGAKAAEELLGKTDFDFYPRELATTFFEDEQKVIRTGEGGEKGLELLCEVAPEVPEVARGDITRLRQVLLNLVGNAIKFTDEGEIAVKVRLEAREERAN